MLRASSIAAVHAKSANGEKILLNPYLKSQQLVVSHRQIGFLVTRAVRAVLKIRYLILGGASAGGVSLHQSYQSWKDSLPDMTWLQDLLPPPEKIDTWQGSIMEMKDKISQFEIDPEMKHLGQERLQSLKSWFDERLERAINATEVTPVSKSEGAGESLMKSALQRITAEAEAANKTTSFFGKTTNPTERIESLNARVETLQEELIKVQLKYQKELERVEKENKELRKQLLLRGKDLQTKRNVKKSLIDMYSEVLDELVDFDSSYKSADHLPRVVVVGDQSSGKTSVLEMIAKARIFPRGAGEMMTRAPVKVTLSEGPYHIAQFKDSTREFDLSKESDLADLRKEVELRMMNSVRQSGKTVSDQVISMSVKGPGLSRIVLVDLPGVISTQTVDMADDTKESILTMSRQYMLNPNAIILCIQDGSVDAERSNVTDLVSQMDPQGKRTIFVLTKVDMAEENLANPDRIQKILSGRLFPMRALGYFAVVTGRGNTNDSIDQIKQYEEDFFRKSRLFKSGQIGSTQVTTKNLSFAVSECFWKMVRETVEQQADGFKAIRFNLETEWKNNFPRVRELVREELFEKARGEILDEVVNLSQVSAKEWEDLITKKLWENMSLHVFENIFLPAAQSGSVNTLNTTVDIRLKQWAEQQLPNKCVEVGWEVLRHKFVQFLDKAKASKDHDPLFDNLKSAVVEEAVKRHEWEDKAPEVLRVIQLNTLEDRSVHDKNQWDRAVKFLEDSVKERLQSCEELLSQIIGPGSLERWYRWKYSIEDQTKKSYVKHELEQTLTHDKSHSPSLNSEEMTVIRKNLENRGIKVDNDGIKDTWFPVYRKFFLKNSLSKAFECRKGYWIYSKGVEGEMDCNEVVLFWRIQQMLRVISNALRQQVVNREGKEILTQSFLSVIDLIKSKLRYQRTRRLEKEIKEVLEDYSQDKDKMFQLLTGKRVQLAEDLKSVRQIQERLEEFIQALNAEK